MLDLAGKENISLWHSCDAEGGSLRDYRSLDAAAPGGKGVSLAIEQALGMPLVKVWLGLLHSPLPYQWDGTGEFYRAVQDM